MRTRRGPRPYQSVCETGARNADPPPARRVRPGRRARGAVRAPRAPRGPHPRRHRDVLRHLRRPRARRRPDASATPAAGSRSLRPRRRGEELAARRRPPPPPRLFDADLPDGFEPRRRDRDARADADRPRPHARAPARRPQPDQKTVVRLTVETHTLGHTPLHGRVFADRRARLRPRTRDGRARPRRDAELARGDGRARRRGRRGRRRRPRGHEREAQLRARPRRRPPTVAAAIVFTRLLEIIDDNLPGTLEDVDSEFLHDLRVAVRRTRSLQRQFKAVYPERLQHHRDEFKRLQADHRRPARPRRLPARLPRPARLAPGRRCAPTWTRCAACSRPAGRAR